MEDDFIPDDDFVQDSAPSSTQKLAVTDDFTPDDIASSSQFEGMKNLESGMKTAMAGMQNMANEAKKAAALNPFNWSLKQMKDNFKQNPPQDINEQAQANAALQLKKQQEKELTQQFLPEEIKKPAIEIKGPSPAKAAVEVGKGAVRGFEGIGSGVGDLIKWAGENIDTPPIALDAASMFLPKKKADGAGLLQKVKDKIADQGEYISGFWKNEMQTGFAAPDAEIFKGSFMQNPSWTRTAAIVAQAIPSLAYATAVTIATKNPMLGASSLGLLEGANTYAEARNAGKDVKYSNMLGSVSTVGNSILEGLPLTGFLDRFLKAPAKTLTGRVAQISKDAVLGMVQEGSEEVAQSFWTNMIAKLGYDGTRNLTDGMLESLIAGAGSGGVLGAFTSSGGPRTDQAIQQAQAAGVTDQELEQAGGMLANQLINNADDIEKKLDLSTKTINSTIATKNKQSTATMPGQVEAPVQKPATPKESTKTKAKKQRTYNVEKAINRQDRQTIILAHGGFSYPSDLKGEIGKGQQRLSNMGKLRRFLRKDAAPLDEVLQELKTSYPSLFGSYATGADLLSAILSGEIKNGKISDNIEEEYDRKFQEYLDELEQTEREARSAGATEEEIAGEDTVTSSEDGEAGGRVRSTPEPEVTETIPPEGEVDTSFDFDIEEEIKAVKEPELFGATKTFRKPKFGEARKLPSQNEGVTSLQKSAIDEQQLDFFKDLPKDSNGDSIKQELEHAYDSKEKYEKAIKEALSSLRRDPGAVSSGKVFKQISQLLRKKGYAPAIGLKVTRAEDVAEIASAFRNPTVELFQVIYTKDGKLVAHEAITFNIPGLAFVPQPFLEDVARKIEKLGADKIYFSHNHPSGNPTPSRADFGLNKSLIKKFGEKFGGHAVLNGDQFVFIDSENVPNHHNYKNEKISFENPSEKVLTDLQLIEAAKTNYKDGKIMAVYLNTKLQTLGVEYMRRDAKVGETLAQKMRAYAAPRVALVISRPGVGGGVEDMDAVDSILGKDFKAPDKLMDIVVHDPKSGNYHSLQGNDEQIFRYYTNPMAMVDPHFKGKMKGLNADKLIYTYDFSEKDLHKSMKKVTEDEAKYEKSPGGEQAETTEADQMATLGKSMGGMEFIKAVEAPELVKLAKELSGNPVTINHLMEAVGRFMHIDGLKSWIQLNKKLFKDPKLVQGVLAHEIGHLIDWLPDLTLKRGNVLGRMASLRDYRKTLLPRPGEDPILSPKERARLRREAANIFKNKNEDQTETQKEPSNKFDPDLVLGIWNTVEQSGIPKPLLDYVKKLDTAGKKSIIKSAMEAKKSGEKITIEEIQNINEAYKKNPESVYDIYKDLLKREILKRKLYEEEVIKEELQKLTKWWHPFDEVSQTHPVTGEKSNYLKYRYSSRELYAEFISVLLNAPAKAKEIAPTAYEAFWNYIGEKDQVMEALLSTQAVIQGSNDELYKQREADIKGMFQKGEQMFRARQIRYEKAKKSIWFHIKNTFWDKNTSLLDKRKEILKTGKIDPNNDPKYILEKNDYIASVTRSFLEKLEPVFNQVVKEKLTEDVDLFLFAERVTGDRAEIANPLGHNPKTAQAQLDFMKKSNPEKYAKVEGLVKQIRDWFKGEINPLMSDIYTPEQMSLVNANEKYASFRVIQYMKDYVSSGIMNQAGTIGEISSPFTALIMKATSMVSGSARNDIKKRVGKFITSNPNSFEFIPAKIIEYPGVFKIENAPDKTMGTISWRENGEWKAYHVEKHLADMFEKHDNNFLMAAGQIIDKVLLNNALFRPMWITFNLTFQGRNLFRDFFRTWKAHPTMTFGKTLNAYRKAFPHAYRKVKGDYDEVINQMQKNSAIGVTLNDLILGETSEDTELQKTLEKFDIFPQKENKFRSVPVIKQIMAVLDAIRFGGDVIETLPKVAGWQSLKDVPVERRAYVVRNLIGTPNYKRAGNLKPIYNSTFLFSNIIKEGYRGMMELATDPELRGQYWRKTFTVNVMSKVLLKLMLMGLFGEWMKRMVEGMTEYDKANYIVIPLGINDDGETRYLRLPQDEDGRLIGALTWKLINGMENPEKAFQDIFSLTAGQLPGPAPMLDIAGKWTEFLSGKNPRDDFRGMDILTDDQRRAGGWHAYEPMLMWTANNTGLSAFSVYDRLQDQSLGKKVLALTPIANSFYRETNYGVQESLREPLRAQQKAEAKERLDRKDALTEDGADALGDIKDTKKRNNAKRFLNRQEAKQSNDPTVRVLVQATSNEQKKVVLREVFDKFKNDKDFDVYLFKLKRDKLISAETRRESLREYRNRVAG